MAVQLFAVLFIAVFLLVIAAKSIATATEDEVLVVFRLGTVHRVYPPGRTLLIPFIDKAVKIRVDQIPGWQKLPESELERKLVQAAIEKSDSFLNQRPKP